VVIPAAVRAALVAHSQQEAPNEACGLLLLRDGRAERYEPGRNAAQDETGRQLVESPTPGHRAVDVRGHRREHE